MALVSAKRSRLQTAAEQGVRGAKSALALVEDPTTLLSAVQIGITLLTIFTGLYGGETFAGPLAEKLTAYGVPTKYTEELAKGIVVLIITFFTLIVGEVVPKRVALLHAETLALRVAPLMRVMARVTAPAVWMLRVTVNAFLKILPVSSAPQGAVTEDDVRALVAEGTRPVCSRLRAPPGRRRAGAGRPQVGSIMIPRQDVIWRPRRADRSAVAAGESSGHALLVARGSSRDLLGITLANLSEAVHRGVLDRIMIWSRRYFPVRSRCCSCWISSSARAPRVVTDEYGGSRASPRRSTSSKRRASCRSWAPQRPEAQRGDGSWLVDGHLPIELQRRLNRRDMVGRAITPSPASCWRAWSHRRPATR
jgi:putative hemolysin